MTVERPIEEVFDFFSDPRNLEQITPPWLRFRVLDDAAEPLREGSELRYRLKVRGFPLSWRSLISRWDPPHCFVDEQLQGPYSRWVHTHSFEGRGEGTVVRDSVEYAVPGGSLVDRLFVRPDLERIFDYRVQSFWSLLAPAP